MIYDDDVFRMACAQFQVIADYLNIDKNERERLMYPKRAIAVTLPVLQNAWLRPRFSGFESFQIKALTIVGRFLGAQISSRETLSQLDKLYRDALTNKQSRRKRAAT